MNKNVKVVIFDNVERRFEDFLKKPLEKDITQRESAFTKEIFYDSLERCNNEAIVKEINEKTKKAIEELDIKTFVTKDLGENKIGIVLYDGRLICYDGGHRYETIVYVLNDKSIRFPLKAKNKAERYILELKKQMVDEGTIKENAKTFVFSQLPKQVQENYRNSAYTCKFVAVQEELTESELSDFCGEMFLRSNSGKSVSTNDKINAEYAGDTFFAVRKQLALFLTAKKNNVDNYSKLKLAFVSDEDRELLMEFKEIAKISNKDNNALLKMLIRCADNGYWESSTNVAVLREICDKHADDSDEEVYEALRTFVKDFVPVAKDLGDMVKRLNLWTAIMLVFGSAKNNPAKYAGKAETHRPMNYEYDKTKENINKNFVAEFKQLCGTRISFVAPAGSSLMSSDIDLNINKWTTSSQNHDNTFCIATALLGCFVGSVKILSRDGVAV